MLKLFMVIYLGSKIGGTVGPLPPDFDRCQKYAAEMQAESQMIARTGRNTVGETIPEKNREQIATFRFQCEWHTTRPKTWSSE